MADFPCSKSGGKKVKSSGWAAFDREMRGHLRSESEDGCDPFPPISYHQSHNLNHHDIRGPSRSFSSVVHTSENSNSLQNRIKSKNLVQDSREIIPDFSAQMAGNDIVLRLKSIHPWADENLISDILAGVENDELKASILLEDMVTPTFCPGGSYPEDLSELGNIPENKATDKYSENISQNLIFPLVEPEWDEDDVYLSHRKDAIRMMRSAAKHSRAASNAYLNGNHPSAKQHSQKAREEWLAAEELNRKAAQEILLIRNSNNDLWKLDLHGLHASEAEQILQEHLSRIETHLSLENSATYKPGFRDLVQDRMVAQTLSDSSIKLTMQTVLHVITGTGNHSRGPASLPAVVRGFLNENGYRFDEIRPGIIAVWPKFRRRPGREIGKH
ncbi:smr (Small MutS Related) domain-containing protein [Wolffia australiana]